MSMKETHTHTWRLHVSDHFTKYLWMIPLKHKQSPPVITELEKLFYILYMFGFPKKLHSDNGEEFRNKNMENLCQSHKITFVPVHPENQQSNKTLLEGESTMEQESTGADHLEREKGRNS